MCSQMWSQQSAPAVCSSTNFIHLHIYTHTHRHTHIHTHTNSQICLHSNTQVCLYVLADVVSTINSSILLLCQLHTRTHIRTHTSTHIYAHTHQLTDMPTPKYTGVSVCARGCGVKDWLQYSSLISTAHPSAPRHAQFEIPLRRSGSDECRSERRGQPRAQDSARWDVSGSAERKKVACVWEREREGERQR